MYARLQDSFAANPHLQDIRSDPNGTGGSPFEIREQWRCRRVVVVTEGPGPLREIGREQ